MIHPPLLPPASVGGNSDYAQAWGEILTMRKRGGNC